MTDVASLRSDLLAWYDTRARTLPWRAPPGSGVRSDPYRVWLSEVMLQQTTVPHATPYFLSFTARWPTVEALAAVDDSELMGAWAGLGYYARARNLLACARAVANDHGGVFPDTEAGLLSLPGVGAYTAAAVAAIAFDRPANVVDGNVERVMARLFAVETPLPGGKVELKRLAGTLVTVDRPGDWAQALMDLGATVCRPRSPLCLVCPIAQHCAGLATGEPERFPVKGRKIARPHRIGVAWVMRDGQGRVAVVRRPDRGLLGGMIGLPTSDWGEMPAVVDPVTAEWRDAGAIEHVFTHFSLTLRIRVAATTADNVIWLDEADARATLPTVFAKALIRASAEI